MADGPVPEPRIRLFVVHAPEDAWFIDGFLLGAVNLPGDDVLVSSRLELGAAIVGEIERGALSPITVVVLSPAFSASPWARFANQLAAHHSIEAADDGTATLIPALLADCEVPLLSRFRASLDFRDRRREHWEAEAARLRARLAAPIPAVVALPCPYPGIRPFRSEDADHFHGRSQEVADLLGRLRDGGRELYVIGPSGCGKSSLVAAGLVPSLRRSPELAGGAFVVRLLRPGADPTRALATALEASAAASGGAETSWLRDAVNHLLASYPDHGRLLIVVDQLEELFTTAAITARAAFFAALGVLRGDARVVLVMTLRADFYAAVMESELWTDLDGQLSRVEVGPLRGDRLQRAIEQPARTLGVYFEPVLVERLVHDVADAPGALPLLQDVLLELWHRRMGSVVRLAEYEAMRDGARTGLAVTVARRADGALADLSPIRRAIARRVLVRLVEFGDDTLTTRRQQTRADLATAGDAPEDIDAVIRHLADQRLITTSGGAGEGRPSVRIDLAHEVLLSAWPVLGDWIRARKDDERRRRALEAKADEWVRHGRGSSRLLDGDELGEARGWLTADKARDLGVSEAILDLLARSEAAMAAQRAEVAARRRRWRRWVMVALVGLTGAVVTVSSLAVTAAQRTREAQRQLARNHVAQGYAYLTSIQPSRAAPYLLAAREAGADDMALRMLFRWATQGVPILRLVHDDRTTAVVWSPDGTRLASASDDRTARIWSAVTGQLMTRPLGHRDRVLAVAWSPDGTRVATASADQTARVWNAVTGQPMAPSFAHQGSIVAVAWSPDGKRVATASGDATARVWNAASGQPVTPPLAHQASVAAIAWSPDGRQVATASSDATARVWDAASGQPVTPPLAHDGGVRAVAWSPDGTHVATASDDKTARVWDATSGQPVTIPFAHEGAVTAVVWSPDGAKVATASQDKTARTWSIETGHWMLQPHNKRVTLTGQHLHIVHEQEVAAVAWSPDGSHIATASADGTARIWDESTGHAVTVPLVHQGPVMMVPWSPDGTRIATASSDHAVRVWHAASRQRSYPSAFKVAWSPDGMRIATAGSRNTAQVWDAVRGQPVTPPLAHQADVYRVAWSPDGTRVATASKDKTARVWDAATGKAATPPLVHQSGVHDIAWSPDGTRLATASQDKTAQIWDAVTGRVVTPPLVHPSAVNTVTWSPDGTRLATTGDDSSARVWDANNGQEVTTPLAHDGLVNRVAWSPDGTRVATASNDKTARVWNATTGQVVTLPLAHAGIVMDLAWSPDGTHLATASYDANARVWDPGSGQLVVPPLAHRGQVDRVAWSPDGTRLATASYDSIAKVWITQVWDPSSGQVVTSPITYNFRASDVTWSPDGRWLATAVWNGDLMRMWDVAADAGTLADWRARVAPGDYRLDRDGVVVLQGAASLADPSPPRQR